MSDARAESLLKSALEKIVYFEARSEQLQADLSGARAEIEQLKRDLAQAATRELELRRSVAELEVAVQRNHRDKDELARVNDALKTERAGLLGKLIESSRIHAAGELDSTDPSFDLAAFISELRNEVLTARTAQASSLPAHILASGALQRPPSPSPVAPVTPPAAVASAAVSGSEALAAASATTPEGAPISASSPAAAPEPAAEQPFATEPVAPAVPSRLDRISAELSQHAERLLREGRLHVSPDELHNLSPVRMGRTEETLFGFSVRELSAPDAPARLRAVERLRSLGERAAAPALATALHAETETPVLVALLQTFGELASLEGVSVVSPMLDSTVPEVRMAALRALLALDPSQAGPRLAAAAEDPDPTVRRRASLLALSLDGGNTLKLEQRVTHDESPEVRRLSALALGVAGGEEARGLLLEALRDTDARVRRAAAQSLGRMLGVDCTHLVSLEDAARRREIRRLAALPLRTSPSPRLRDFTGVGAEVLRAEEAPRRPATRTLPSYDDGSLGEALHQDRVEARASYPVEEPDPELMVSRDDLRDSAQWLSHGEDDERPSASYADLVAPEFEPEAEPAQSFRAAAPMLEPAPAPNVESLCGTVVFEVRSAIRGRSLAELVNATHSDSASVEDACSLLIARGQVIRRGLKYFVA